MITYQNHINGEWVSPHSGTYSQVTNPADLDDVFAQAPLSDAQDVQAAISACEQAEENGHRRLHLHVEKFFIG